MRVVAVANQKGGCGKTTTAINLAGCFSFLGRRTLLIDLDAQGHSCLGLGIAPEELERSLYDVMSPRVASPLALNDVIIKLSASLHLAPADFTMAALEQELSGVPGRENRLAEALAPLEDSYDYVFIDCAPGLGILTFNALRIASEVLVPVEPSLFSLHGLSRFIETVRMAEEEFSKEFLFHALVTNYDPRTKAARQYLREIREHLQKICFTTVIRRNIRVLDAAAAGRPLAEFDRDSTGFRDYMACATELIERSRPAAIGSAEGWALRTTAAMAGLIDIEKIAGDIAAESSLEAASGFAEEESGPEAVEGLLAEILPMPLSDAALWVEMEPFRETSVAAPAGESNARFGLAESSGETNHDGVTLEISGPVRQSDGMLFSLRTPAAEDVRIAGEFNDWLPERMQRRETAAGDIWEYVKPLDGGVYRYKFVVNGDWINDPHNEKTLPNPYGGSDSVVHIAN